MQHKRSNSLIFMVLISTFALGTVSGFIGGYIEDELFVSDSQSQSSQSDNPTVRPVNSVATDLETLVKQVTPSVVSLANTTRSTGFFGQTQIAQSAGTGVILTKDGYILTNKHVISNSEGPVEVEVAGGTQYTAQIVAVSPDNDLAILKINATDLVPIKLGDSSELALGQSVIAIGNALGEFQNTVTEGILSGLNRTVVAGDTIYIQEQLTGLLQTDAAVNPGNSGGPLIDQKTGTMIGINTAASTNAQNIGLAIPVNQAKEFIQQAISIR